MTTSSGGAGKQLKLSELKRVVNVDVVKKYAAALEAPAGSIEAAEVERILDELAKKTPSREILVKTRLGFILKDLAARRSLPKRTRDKAAQLRLKWKEFHKRLLYAEKYDVKCDKPTTEQRERARLGLERAIRASSEPDDEAVPGVAGTLEFALFRHCGNLINARYFAATRRLLAALQEPTGAAKTFLERRTDPGAFVAECLRTAGAAEQEDDEVTCLDGAENSSSSSSSTSAAAPSTSAAASMPRSASCMSFSSSAFSGNGQNISANRRTSPAAVATPKSGKISAFFKAAEPATRTSSSKYF